MKVQTFDLASRPRISARDALATRAALRALATLPHEWEVELPVLGRAHVAVAGVSPPSAAPRSPPPALPIRRGVDRGRLTVEGAFASRLLAAFLGGKASIQPVRAIGPAERGVLAGIVGSLLDPWGWSVGVEPSPLALPALGVIAIRVSTSAGVGSVDVQWPDSADAFRGDPHGNARIPTLASRLARLPAALRVEIGATRLRAAELVLLKPGDAVVFDGTAAFPFGEAENWPALAVIGHLDRMVWSASIDRDSNVTITGKLEIAEQEDEMSDGKRSTPAQSDDAAITEAFAGAPIDVVAELGRLTLRGGELAGLVPGAVFSLGAARGIVALRVGGERWADGEIVDVDGELGVRVTRVLRR